MFKAAVSALVLGATLFTGVAQAAQVLTLNYQDLEMRGGGNLNLKRELERAYPRLRVENFELQGVRVVAKSRQGQGRVALVVGRDSSYQSNVDGRPREFDSRDPRSFSIIDLNSPSRRSEGQWMLQFQGNIKLRQIQVKIEEDRWGGRPGDGPGRPGPGGPGRPGDGPGRPGRPGDGPGRPGHGPRDDRGGNPAKDLIGVIGGIIIDEIGKR